MYAAPGLLRSLTVARNDDIDGKTMPTRLNAKDANFEEAFAALLAAKREASVDVREAVEKIVADVRKRGDEALVEYTRRFDRLATPSISFT